ncbi:TonB-dependent receptor [Desulfurivibrio dismutans]|uniref:TonB-dependent receptor n=1 Tax=Desulfurivibrio dismutans TaxID=1398908 RepID=UPI0023DCBF5B|nr:TonB-dependent receptor [Desulfurivibrio alkaliphilus]MDF1615065.1 TonB-dependent receptor [Desulfurivibrio alkaliphilus]
MKKEFFTVAAIGLLAGPALAGEIRRELDEVVVTSSRIEEQRKDSTATIEVIGQDEVERVKYRNAGELLQRVPGVLTSNFGGDEELTSIRVPTHFTNPYTLVLINGRPSRTYGSGGVNFREINSANIERIEVVKGPASALYGSNAIGGVINLITKKPTAEPEITAWGEAGEYDEYRGGAYVSGTSESLSYNVDFNFKDRKGWRENTESERQAANVRLQHFTAGASIWSFEFDYVKFDNNTAGSLDEQDFDDDWQQSYHTFANVEMEKFAPAIAYATELAGGDFDVTLGYRRIDHVVYPGYSFRQLSPVLAASTYSDIEGYDIDLQLLYTRELDPLATKLVSGIDLQTGKHEAEVYGLAVTRDPVSKKYTSYTVTGLNDSYDIETEAAAPYLQLDRRLGDNFKLQAGARYDWVRYELTDNLLGTDGLEGKQSFSRLSPKVGLTYDPLANLNLYASYSQGFVVPTTSQLFTSRLRNPDLDPEKADNYEVGLRSILLDGRAKLDLALYHMTIREKIVQVTTGPFTSEYRNAAKTEHTGLELAASYAPLVWSRVGLSYTYAENKFDRFRDGGVDYSGNWLPRSPRHRLNVRLAVLPFEGFEVELEMDEISRQYADNANELTYSRPALFNLRAGYDWQSWSFWAHVNNLADKEYATYVTTSSTSDTGMGLYSGGPRTFFAGLSYRWGGSGV